MAEENIEKCLAIEAPKLGPKMTTESTPHETWGVIYRSKEVLSVFKPYQSPEDNQASGIRSFCDDLSGTHVVDRHWYLPEANSISKYGVRIADVLLDLVYVGIPAATGPSASQH